MCMVMDMARWLITQEGHRGTLRQGQDGRTGWRAGGPLSMTLKELDKLQRLAQRKGQTVDEYVRDLVRRVVR